MCLRIPELSVLDSFGAFTSLRRWAEKSLKIGRETLDEVVSAKTKDVRNTNSTIKPSRRKVRMSSSGDSFAKIDCRSSLVVSVRWEETIAKDFERSRQGNNIYMCEIEYRSMEVFSAG
jgi:hypothetical protein